MMMKAILPVAMIAALALSGSAFAGSRVNNDMSRCAAGKGPAVLVTVRGVKASTGKMRIQSYPATNAAWLEKGRWLHRIEKRASRGIMRFCMPIPRAGNYGIAVRHDKNNNGKTDISSDGGGFSRNPSVSVFRAVLGKSVVPIKKSRFYAGKGVTRITINLRYR